jgi:hypothetical protein
MPELSTVEISLAGGTDRYGHKIRVDRTLEIQMRMDCKTERKPLNLSLAVTTLGQRRDV